MSALSGEPWRGLAQVSLVEAAGSRFFSCSIDDVDPATVSGEQSTWNGTPGQSATLRFEWAATGTPINGIADDATVHFRLPGGGTDIGSTWAVTIGSASGSATKTIHFDDDPFSSSAGSNRTGMLEIFFSVQRTSGPAGGAAWGPMDSRGNGSIAGGWARGKLRSNGVLSSFTITNDSLGGSSVPNPFAFPDTTYNRVVLTGATYRSVAVRLGHANGTPQSGTIYDNKETGSSGTSATRDFTWGGTTAGSASRINTAYAEATSFGVAIAWNNISEFGGTSSDREYDWHGSGQPAGWTAITGTVNDFNTLKILRQGNVFNADPTITFNTVAAGQSVYKRYRATTHSFKIKNARNADIGITAPWDLRDSTPAVKASYSAAPSSGTYTGTYTIGGSDKAWWTIFGDQWTIATTFGDMTGIQVTANVFRVTRKIRFSTLSNGINDRIFAGHAANPTSQNDSFNRGDDVFFDAYVYDELEALFGSVSIDFNTRFWETETYDGGSTSFTLASGRFSGASAKHTIGASETFGGHTLVIAEGATASGTNQPRGGTGGVGNFAESIQVPCEFAVIEGSTDRKKTYSPCLSCGCFIPDDPEHPRFGCCFAEPALPRGILPETIYVDVENLRGPSDNCDCLNIFRAQLNWDGSTSWRGSSPNHCGGHRLDLILNPCSGFSMTCVGGNEGFPSRQIIFTCGFSGQASTCSPYFIQMTCSQDQGGFGIVCGECLIAGVPDSTQTTIRLTAYEL